MKSFLSGLYRLLPPWLLRPTVWLGNAKFNISVAGVFFDPGGRVLVLRHVFRRRHPWGVPAGYLMPGESPEDAAARELKEETGLDGTVDRIVAVRPLGPRHMEVVAVGTVNPAEDFALSHEIFEARFCDPATLPSGMMPDQADMVRRAAAARALHRN